MHEQELDVLGINETRLDSDYPTDLISIDGYTWIAKNINRSGGGVGFYIINTINFHERLDLNNNEIETLTIEVLKPKMKPFLITTWYRPPNSAILTNSRNLKNYINK
jgi:exonuclease III